MGRSCGSWRAGQGGGLLCRQSRSCGGAGVGATAGVPTSRLQGKRGRRGGGWNERLRESLGFRGWGAPSGHPGAQLPPGPGSAMRAGRAVWVGSRLGGPRAGAQTGRLQHAVRVGLGFLSRAGCSAPCSRPARCAPGPELGLGRERPSRAPAGCSVVGCDICTAAGRRECPQCHPGGLRPAPQQRPGAACLARLTRLRGTLVPSLHFHWGKQARTASRPRPPLPPRAPFLVPAASVSPAARGSWASHPLPPPRRT